MALPHRIQELLGYLESADERAAIAAVLPYRAEAAFAVIVRYGVGCHGVFHRSERLIPEGLIVADLVGIRHCSRFQFDHVSGGHDGFAGVDVVAGNGEFDGLIFNMHHVRQ
jgi:hypothetical protein